MHEHEEKPRESPNNLGVAVQKSEFSQSDKLKFCTSENIRHRFRDLLRKCFQWVRRTTFSVWFSSCCASRLSTTSVFVIASRTTRWKPSSRPPCCSSRWSWAASSVSRPTTTSYPIEEPVPNFTVDNRSSPWLYLMPSTSWCPTKICSSRPIPRTMPCWSPTSCPASKRKVIWRRFWGLSPTRWVVALLLTPWTIDW